MPQFASDRAHASRRGALIAAATSLLGGCTLDPGKDHRGTDAPSAAPLPRTPRVAWVFSSGGPRGFVHVGVLKALAELKLVPDLIVGASAGALVGCLRAALVPMPVLESLTLELQPWRLARLNVSGSEPMSGSAIATLVRELCQKHARVTLLERLPILMVCVAQRLSDGASLGFSRGDVGLAVQASAAIEGQFSPVRIRGQRYADADLRTPLPVRLARALGASRVLAVDASAHEDKAPPGTERWRALDLRKRELTAPDARLANVLLHPDFGYYAGLSREYRERAIDAGYRATLAVADRLRRMHA